MTVRRPSGKRQIHLAPNTGGPLCAHIWACPSLPEAVITQLLGHPERLLPDISGVRAVDGESVVVTAGQADGLTVTGSPAGVRDLV